MNVSMRIRTTILLTLAAIVVLVAGCGDEITGPTSRKPAVEPPVEEIKTPVKMQITGVTFRKWPAKKDSGDDWDWDPFNATPRQPDLYGKLGNHVTTTVNNASQSRDYAVSWDGRSYCRANYVDYFIFFIYDEDGTSADDLVSQYAFTPRDYYRRDNATTFTVTLADPSMQVELRGTWIY